MIIKIIIRSDSWIERATSHFCFLSLFAPVGLFIKDDNSLHSIADHIYSNHAATTLFPWLTPHYYIIIKLMKLQSRKKSFCSVQEAILFTLSTYHKFFKALFFFLRVLEDWFPWFLFIYFWSKCTWQKKNSQNDETKVCSVSLIIRRWVVRWKLYVLRHHWVISP